MIPVQMRGNFIEKIEEETDSFIRTGRFGDPVFLLKNLQRACLPRSMACVKVFSDFGIRAVVQAGITSWPIINPEEDDGERDTHLTFGYPVDQLEFLLSENLGIPFHCWVVLPSAKHIVDASVKHFPDCLRDCGNESNWTAPLPPNYLWVDYDELPVNVVYQAQEPTTLYVLSMVKKFFPEFFYNYVARRKTG